MSKAPPLLLGTPVPLPAAWGGDYAGAGYRYNLDRCLNYAYEQASLLADLNAEQITLTADRVAADPHDLAAAAELDARQATLNRRIYARRVAYLVYDGVGVPAGAPDKPETWEGLSIVVLRWLANQGMRAALNQAAAPFFDGASPSSDSTGESTG